MKETTRYAVLLFSVLTLITSSYLAINLADTSTETASSVEEPEPVNDTVEDDQTVQNETEALPPSERPEPDSLIGKSIRGFQIIIEDMRKASGILSQVSD